MARRISLEPHLTIEELEGRYRSTKDPVERSRWAVSGTSSGCWRVD